jgi:ABC-type nitrate/sulfonate/bicarbonate transport system substrate-binding protein
MSQVRTGAPRRGGPGKRRLSGFLGLALLALAAACGGGEEADEAAAPSPGQRESLKVMATAQYDLATPGLAGVELGTFEEKGLDVELLVGQEATEALASGDIDIASAAPNRFVGAIERGLEVTIVGPTVDDWPQYMIVSSDLGVDSPEEFQGGRIGVSRAGSAGHYSAVKFAESIDLPEDKYEIVPMGGLDAMTAGLISGSIDAMTWGAVAAFQLEHDGEAKVLANVGDSIGPNPLSVLAVRNEVLESRPEAVRKFCEAYYETNAQLLEDPEKSTKMLIDDWGYAPETAERVFTESAKGFSKSSTMTDEMFDNIAEATRFTVEEIGDLQGDDVKEMYKNCGDL